MGLIVFIIELIIAYFMGYVLVVIFGAVLGLFVMIFYGIVSTYKWIISHPIESSLMFAAIVLIVFLVKSGYFQKKYLATHNMLSASYKSILAWNDRHKPKDIRSAKRFGAIALIIGIFGAYIFYDLELWYVSIVYAYLVISGISYLVFPEYFINDFS